MSDDFGFAAPPFDPDAALTQLQRSLRDLKLAPRGARFELRGKPVVEITRDGEALAVKLARRAMLTPEWDRLRIGNAAEQRKLLDDVKKRLARWDQED